MKLQLLTAVIIFSTISVKAETIETPPEPSSENFAPGHGAGNQATPINDYAGLLIASGFIAATAIYFRKEQLIKKNK